MVFDTLKMIVLHNFIHKNYYFYLYYKGELKYFQYIKQCFVCLSLCLFMPKRICYSLTDVFPRKCFDVLIYTDKWFD
jgi:hypothetical protein